MRLVLDTNVVISAFLNPSGGPSHIVKLVLEGKADMVYNTTILLEYVDVMNRPKFKNNIDHDLILNFVNTIMNIGLAFDPIPSTKPFADESDRIFYDTAKNSDSFLITGNIRHFPKEPFIMLPGDFLKQVREV